MIYLQPQPTPKINPQSLMTYLQPQPNPKINLMINPH